MKKLLFIAIITFTFSSLAFGQKLNVKDVFREAAPLLPNYRVCQC